MCDSVQKSKRRASDSLGRQALSAELFNKLGGRVSYRSLAQVTLLRRSRKDLGAIWDLGGESSLHLDEAVGVAQALGEGEAEAVEEQGLGGVGLGDAAEADGFFPAVVAFGR